MQGAALHDCRPRHDGDLCGVFRHGCVDDFLHHVEAHFLSNTESQRIANQDANSHPNSCIIPSCDSCAEVAKHLCEICVKSSKYSAVTIPSRFAAKWDMARDIRIIGDWSAAND